MSTVCLTETSTLPRNDRYTLAELEPGEVEEDVYLVDFGLPSHEHSLGDTIQSGLSLERPLQRDVESSARSSRALRDDTTEEGELEAAEHTFTDSPSYFIDLTPDHAKNPRDASAPWVQLYGVYTRDSETILGDTISTDSHGDSTSNSNTNRCFNCGSPEHAVSSCPVPRNRELIALSRQYYNFFQESRGDFQRIHVIEAWRQQRLTWLEHFDPGEIRGELLRDAIGTDGQEGPEWLANMALWGYPKGWVGTDDPRHEVCRRILNDAIGFTADDVDSVEFGTFRIYGDSAEAEHVDFHDDDDFPTLNDENLESASASSSGSDTGLSNDRTPSPPPSPPPPPNIRRWAQYPPTHFSSQLLPIYNGMALPAISSSYNDDRQRLWERIVSGSGEPRLPPPPPPTSEPPPLPPPHPSLPPRPPPPPPTSEPPPLPPAHPSLPPRPMPPEYECKPVTLTEVYLEDEVDMDMSDSE